MTRLFSSDSIKIISCVLSRVNEWTNLLQKTWFVCYSIFQESCKKLGYEEKKSKWKGGRGGGRGGKAGKERKARKRRERRSRGERKRRKKRRRRKRRRHRCCGADGHNKSRKPINSHSLPDNQNIKRFFLLFLFSFLELFFVNFFSFSFSSKFFLSF